jgi:hypothetical protein
MEVGKTHKKVWRYKNWKFCYIKGVGDKQTKRPRENTMANLQVDPAIQTLISSPAGELTHREIQSAARALRDMGIPMKNISKTRAIRETWAASEQQPDGPELMRS